MFLGDSILSKTVSLISTQESAEVGCRMAVHQPRGQLGDIGTSHTQFEMISVHAILEPFYMYPYRIPFWTSVARARHAYCGFGDLSHHPLSVSCTLESLNSARLLAASALQMPVHR